MVKPEQERGESRLKNNRHGAASLLTELEYSKIRKHIKSKRYKLLLDLAWYTGERWGALVQLEVSDCYSNGLPLEQITFKAITRKASPDGKRKTRQVPIHSVLKESLENYQPDQNCSLLFPNRDCSKCITLRWADNILRSSVDKAGLSAKGISTHSTRRTFITKLHQNGTDLYTIKAITGHQDFKSLERYVDIASDRIKGAIATL